MDELASPFLRLPVELQIKVLNNISLYSDLKALRMTSKELSNIATPRLYRKVDLRMSDDYGAIKSINQKKKTAKCCLESTLYSSHRQICLLSGFLRLVSLGQSQLF